MPENGAEQRNTTQTNESIPAVNKSDMVGSLLSNEDTGPDDGAADQPEARNSMESLMHQRYLPGADRGSSAFAISNQTYVHDGKCRRVCF